MKILDANFTKNRPLYHQISDHVRSLILAGDLAPGDRLPSTDVLAETWQTASRTVHLALVALEKEGLLAREHGKGTFVRKREEKLTCVGVFATVVVEDSQYLQALHKALQEELRQAGIEMDLWLDPRPDEEFGEPWQPFVHAAAHREFQAVIGTNSSGPHMRWQTKLPVPAVFQGGPGLPNAAGADVAQLAELSAQALAQQGCRSVGVIGSTHPRFCERLLEQIADLGLRVKNEWIRLAPPGTNLPGGVAQERFGHEEFLRLWAQPERPDGLIVPVDTLARGVVLGLLEKQVRVPDELKLVLHKNETVDLYCPMPATFAVFSERALARALIAQVQKQFRGEPCEPISIPYRLMAHPAAEQTRYGAYRGNS